MSYRAQRLAALALLVLFFPSVAMATAYALRPVRKPLVVYALDTHHRVLPPGSKLKPGQHITVVATGFRARTRVQVVDLARRKVVAVHADSKGVARKALIVPGRTAKRPSFALDGQIATAAPAPKPSPGRTSARRDPQVVTATVPLLRRYPYAIKGSSGVKAGGVGLDPGSHTGESSGSGGLASTGTDVLALLAGAALLIALGGVVLRVGRRNQA